VRGLGFGGQIGFCRLWLDADFEECYVLQSDATYSAGSLLPGSGLQTSFRPTHIEVWGCGGEDALAAQAAKREADEGIREQARRVDSKAVGERVRQGNVLPKYIPGHCRLA